MAEPIARSPITPAPPVKVEHSWEVSARRGGADLLITDCTPLAKVLIRAAETGAAARALGVGFGRSTRDGRGTLVAGSGPGEWTLISAPGTAPEVAGRIETLPDDGLVSVVDVTHGRALVRISGARSADLLAKVCGIDLSDDVTPDGSAFRSSVAKVVTDVVRDDEEENGMRSYLLHCPRSYGQYLFDALLDAGDEFGIEITGFIVQAARGKE